MSNLWVFLNSKIFLYILTVLLLIFGLTSFFSLKRESRTNVINKQNIEALTDSIRIERTKNGALQASISGFIASVDELKYLNENLYKESQQQKGQLLSLNRIVFSLEQDKKMLQEKINELESIMGQPIFINDSIFSVSWTLRYDWDENNFDIFKGNTFIGTKFKDGITLNDIETLTIEELILIEHLKTEMESRITQIELVFGQRIEGNKLRVFAQSNYPGFTPKTLEGVLIDPNTSPYMRKLMRQRQWFPNTFTIGIGPSVGYNFFNSKPYLGIGINLNYNIYRF